MCDLSEKDMSGWRLLTKNTYFIDILLSDQSVENFFTLFKFCFNTYILPKEIRCKGSIKERKTNYTTESLAK